jgi:hypothetical protein
MGVFLGAKFIKKGEAVDPAVANVPTSGFAEKFMNPHMALGGQAISTVKNIIKPLLWRSLIGILTRTLLYKAGHIPRSIIPKDSYLS